MKREYLLLLLFAILGFTGGTTTQQWLAHDGALATPAYSFSAESTLGLYRAGTGQICSTGASDLDGRVCFQNGQMQIATAAISSNKLYLDTATSAGMYIYDQSTDWFGWGTETSTLDYFIGTYGTRFVMAPSQGSTSNMHNYDVSSGNLVMRNSSGTAWTGLQGLGYTGYGLKFDIGGTMAIGTDGANTTVAGFESGGADSILWKVNNTTYGYSRGKDLLEITGTDVNFYVYPNNGKPGATDCDAASEDGRLQFDYSNNRLYVCNATSTNNWMYVDLTE